MIRLRFGEKPLIEEFAAHIWMEQIDRNAERLESCHSTGDFASEITGQPDRRQAPGLAGEIDFVSTTDPTASVGNVNSAICEGSKSREEIIGESQNVMRYLSHGGNACGKARIKSLAVNPCERVSKGHSACGRLTGQD